VVAAAVRSRYSQGIYRAKTAKLAKKTKQLFLASLARFA
jgi:hypothetical protein